MLLTRVAESIYWIGRYNERVECTARLVATHANLSFPMPAGRDMSWGSLLLAGTTSSGELDEDQLPPTEADVIRALVTDLESPSSIAASLAAARDNMRSSRQRLPREAWEALNRLYFYALDGATQAQETPRRYRYLQHLIVESQKLTGILHGTMSRDSAYAFFMLGQNLERADGTLRVVNADADFLVGPGAVDEPFADVRWMHVLKSLSAFQMYRRVTPATASRSASLRFLLQDLRFPRSVAFCLDEVGHRLKGIPNSQFAVDECDKAMRAAMEARIDTLGRADVRGYIDQLQQRLDAVHDAIAETWFRPAMVPKGL